MNPNAPACADMRERLLEADPAELRGEGDSTVALHIGGCTACAAAARRILGSQQQMADALSALTLPAPVVPPASQAVRRARGRRSLLRALAPLAAAAILVLFLLQQRAVDELPRLEPVPEPTAYAPDMPVVNATGGSDVAVMQTSNPNITVVWFLERERQ